MFAILTANSKPGISLVACIFPSSVLSFSLSLSFSLRAYLHITSLGYAYLLSTVRNLLDLLRACVSIYPSPTGRSRELCVTECITLSFSLPLRSLSFKRTPLRILACIRDTHTHACTTHKRSRIPIRCRFCCVCISRTSTSVNAREYSHCRCFFWAFSAPNN